MQTARPQPLVFLDEEFRRTQPVADPPRPFHFPPIQHFTLDSGLEVYLVEQHALPLVSMDLSFGGGERVVPRAQAGLAGICMAMLTEGTAQLDKRAYAAALGDLASTIATYATEDAHGIALSSLTKHLDRTFELFDTTLRAPGFRQRDFDLLVKRSIEATKQAAPIPQLIKARAIMRVLYGDQHPLSTFPSESSQQAITLDDCRRFAATWLRPRGAQLFVVGDQTEAQIRARFEALPWTGGAPAIPPLPVPEPLAGRVFFIDVPGAAQSQIAQVRLGPTRATPDVLATAFAGSILAGGFASRISMNLREAKGYAYVVRGGFHFGRETGMFAIHASVQTNATVPSLLEIEREHAAFVGDAPPTASELEQVKTGEILALPGRFATAQAALAQYRSLVYLGLPLDEYHHHAAAVAAVSLDEVTAAAKRHLPIDGGAYVVVGDGAAPQLGTDGTLRERLVKLGDVVEL